MPPDPPARKSRVLVEYCAPHESGCDAFVTVGKDSCRYTFRQIAAAPGETGWEVERKDKQRPARHHVLVAKEYVSCDCTAGLVQRAMCKHVLAVQQLTREGHL